MKSKSKQEQKINYGFYHKPANAAQDKFDAAADEAFNAPDPAIGYTFARAHEAVDNNGRFNNPFGGEYSHEVADAIRSNEHNQLDMQQGQAYREDSAVRKVGKLAALESSARARDPYFASSGGTVTTTSNPGFGSIIGAGISAGAGLGSAAMT